MGGDGKHMKICSLLPSSTEILYALGLGDQVAAVTHECDFPQEAASKPRITESIIDHERLSGLEIDHHVSANIGRHGSIYRLREDLLEALKPEFLETVSRLDADIAADSNNAELYVARAWQLNDIAQPRLALHNAQTALQFEPNSAGALAEAGYALAKLDRGDEAFDNVKRATEADPSFSTAWQYRGELEMQRGTYVDAVESLSRALTINQSTTALQKREECYRRLGLFAKAEEDHRAVEDLNARSFRQR